MLIDIRIEHLSLSFFIGIWIISPLKSVFSPMLLPTVVFYFSIAFLPSFGKNPDRCWMNNWINDTDVSGPCPLFSDERRLASYCVISLKPENQPNQMRCRRCYWRQNEDKICQATKHWERRDCCCKTPNCNKVIFKDALPGWHTNNSNAAAWPNSCVSAEFSNGDWKLFSGGAFTYHHEVCNPWVSTGQQSMDRQCIVRFIKKEKNVTLMKLGCAENKDICEEHTVSSPCKSNGTQTLCCCNGHLCNQNIYRRYGFPVMTEMRQVEEQQYGKEMDEAKKLLTAQLWFKNETYWERKVFVDGTLIIGTSIYMSVIIIAFVLYRPIDIDKRPKPANASREVVESIKSTEPVE